MPFSNIFAPSPNSLFLVKRVQKGCCSNKKWRSGWGIKPKTRPVVSQMPAISSVAPLGFSGYDRLAAVRSAITKNNLPVAGQAHPTLFYHAG